MTHWRHARWARNINPTDAAAPRLIRNRFNLGVPMIYIWLAAAVATFLGLGTVVYQAPLALLAIALLLGLLFCLLGALSTAIDSADRLIERDYE